MAIPPYRPEESWRVQTSYAHTGDFIDLRDGSDETWKSLQPTKWRAFMAAGFLPSPAIQEVLYLVEAQYGLSRMLTIGEEMAGDWRFTALEGKLTTRFRLALEKAVGIPRLVDRRIEGELAKLISQYKAKPLFYRISDKLWWAERDYGAEGSCMWTYHKAGRATLVSANARALLVRNNDNGYLGKGVGRAWVVPFGGNLLVRNLYGLPSQVMLDMLRFQLQAPLPAIAYHIDVLGNINEYSYQSSYCNASSFLCHWQGSELPKPSGKKFHANSPEFGRKLVTAGCYCVAGYNEKSTKGKRVCDNCPWKDKETGEVALNWCDDKPTEELQGIEEVVSEHSDSPHSSEGGNDVGSGQATQYRQVEAQVCQP